MSEENAARASVTFVCLTGYLHKGEVVILADEIVAAIAEPDSEAALASAPMPTTVVLRNGHRITVNESPIQVARRVCGPHTKEERWREGGGQ